MRRYRSEIERQGNQPPADSVRPRWWKRDIVSGMTGPDVAAVKRILGLDTSTGWDAGAEQLLTGYFGTPVVTAEVAEQIGESAAQAAGLPPLWWPGEELSPGASGPAVAAVRGLLGLESSEEFDAALEDAVRRYQGNHEITPDGVVTEQLAMLLGEAS